MRTDKMKIDEFIKYHNENYINYCEVLIHPDGDISYAIPSHQEKLINLTCYEREVLFDILDIWCDVMLELVNMTGCISVWYNTYINPKKITKEQINSLNKLYDNECISSDLKIDSEYGYH